MNAHGHPVKSRRPDSTSSKLGADLVLLADLVAERVAADRVAADALLDSDGAARLLNVPASWVRAEARVDRIPHLRLGRYVRFDRDELIAWSAARARGPRVRRTGSSPVSNGGASA